MSPGALAPGKQWSTRQHSMSKGIHEFFKQQHSQSTRRKPASPIMHQMRLQLPLGPSPRGWLMLHGKTFLPYKSGKSANSQRVSARLPNPAGHSLCLSYSLLLCDHNSSFWQRHGGCFGQPCRASEQKVPPAFSSRWPFEDKHEQQAPSLKYLLQDFRLVI